MKQDKLIVSFWLITLVIVSIVGFLTNVREHINAKEGFLLLLGLMGLNYIVHELIMRAFKNEN